MKTNYARDYGVVDEAKLIARQQVLDDCFKEYAEKEIARLQALIAKRDRKEKAERILKVIDERS